MPDDDRRTATSLLQSWRGGDRDALNRLLPVVYDELSNLARRALYAERSDHTLQTRALVHEAYLRLVDAEIPFHDRAHFMAVAARSGSRAHRSCRPRRRLCVDAQTTPWMRSYDRPAHGTRLRRVDGSGVVRGLRVRLAG